MKKFRYNNIFLYGSLQFSGHVEEYFGKNAKKAIVFIAMPRLNKTHNILRIYNKGVLEQDITIPSHAHFLLYYLLWFFNYWRIVFTHFPKKEKTIVLSGHPISFFGMKIQQLFRNITFVYWVGDYFPGKSMGITIYEKIKKYYHDKLKYACYLSDGINNVMNGKVCNTQNKKTVMWGVKPPRRTKKQSKTCHILFIGVIKPSQGLEHVFSFLTKHPEYHLHIVGVCEGSLYKSYRRIIKKKNIQKQVTFPNKFYDDTKIARIASTCDVGIALYDSDKSNPTFYTDPGKIKAYIEYGLPVVMTDVSGIAPFIKKYSCGEIVTRDEKSLSNAFRAIHRNYSKYQHGLRKFAKHFEFSTYYKSKFNFLEHI